MRVEQLRPHLWRWTAPHPDWRPEHAEGGQGWEREVACAAIVRDDEFVLVDPLAPAETHYVAEFWRAVERDVEHHGPPHVVLTIPWHFRSTAEVAERFPGTRVWVRADADPGPVTPTDRFGVGDELPGGLLAFDGHWMAEAILWSPAHRALLTGDVILGAPDGEIRLLPDSWLPEGMTRDGLRDALAPLLDLPVELVLPAHGEPLLAGGAAALERAIRG
jgi:glyoxylase-like metal-dependent hydrolase (beta-lactamase superfamily II)